MITQQNSKRDEIVKRAFAVFYKEGFHATGVDKVLSDSGISKRTLYKYFPSKEALIAATVHYYQQTTFSAVEETLKKRATTAKEKILALFDLRREALAAGDYSGCFAVNAKLEYEGRHPDIEMACAGFHEKLESFLTALCKEAGCNDPAATAQTIMILYMGTIVYGQSQHNPQIALRAKDVVKGLLNA